MAKGEKKQMNIKRNIPIALSVMLLWSALTVTANADAAKSERETEQILPSAVSASSYSELSEVRVTSLRVTSYPTRTIYDAFEQLDKSGLTLRAQFEGGDEREIYSDEISVSYQRDTCLRVGDTHVFLSYGGVSVSVPVTVNRVEYDLSPLELSDFSVVYNGSFNTVSLPFPDIVGLDGIPLSVKVRGGGESVGSYDISIDFESTSVDYYLPEERVITLTVTPFCAEVVWDNLSFVYDGKTKSPKAYFFDVFGNKISPATVGSAVGAGADYQARVIFNDPNYTLTNTETDFEIKKADYDFSGVKWSADSFVYDGSGKSISVSGLPGGVRVVSYLGDRATNVGKYTVTAKLAWEEANYNAPNALTHTWEILPARYDLSGFSFVPGEYVYNGKMHYPELKGKMPVGADGIALEYSFSEGACHVSDGTVSVAVIFFTKSGNYIAPDPIYSSVTVKPKGISVTWGSCELTYSGEAQTPTAIAAECVVKVRGGGVSVGKYIAEAYTENTDYVITNAVMDFTVKKAENRWISIPDNHICYEGKTPILPVQARFGEAQLIFYSDSMGQAVISAPVSAGKYYARAAVPNTENYSGIESEIFCIEIVKIVPVSFIGAVNRTNLRAFEILSASDLSCTVINNDGSREEVDSLLVEVVYENGDSLRKKDKSVTLRYGGFSFKMNVSVDFADYDISGAVWCGTETVYDGAPKTPWLSGLPSGVGVREYIGGGAVNAGSYTVMAALSYDEENYNPPSIDATTLLVKKCILDIPIVTEIYSGTPMAPQSNSHLFTIDGSQSFREAGTYRVSATVIDSENYEFLGGGSVCDAYFAVTPRIVTVACDNVVLHLFERLREVDYSIVSGECLPGDSLMLEQYREGNRVAFRSNNPNYTVISEGGEIRRLPYPSLLFWAYFLPILGIISALLTVAYFTLIKRPRLQNAIAIIRCRWHNRRMVVYPPRRTKYQKPKGTYLNDDFLDGPTDDPTDDSADDFTDGPRPSPTSPTPDAPSENSKGSEEEQENSGSDEQYDSENLGGFGVNAEHADSLITDSLAKDLINRDGEIVYTDGKSKNIVNVDTLSENFNSGDRVDVNALKNKSLVPYDTAYIKVLARGEIDKPLSVFANDFSLSAVKMIALTGGKAIKAVTIKTKKESEKNSKKKTIKNQKP